jgi:3-dehydroquinate synthase
MSLSRTGLLLGFGGGVCTDITSVAASWLRRGTHHIRVPTTLIGQVDAGIGYKGAINFEREKNYLGCYHAPERVLIAPMLLSTLPTKHLREGFAEIVKIAVVCNLDLLDLIGQYATELVESAFQSPFALGSTIIWQAAVHMLRQLETNPYEGGTYERLVDFGHTFSPLLESTSAFELSHGEAVALDMALSTALSTELMFLAATSRDRILTALNSLRLPLYSDLLTYELCCDALRHAALHRGGDPNLVLPADRGRAIFVHRPESLTKDVFVRALHVLAKYQPSALESKGSAEARHAVGADRGERRA